MMFNSYVSAAKASSTERTFRFHPGTGQKKSVREAARKKKESTFAKAFLPTQYHKNRNSFNHRVKGDNGGRNRFDHRAKEKHGTPFNNRSHLNQQREQKHSTTTVKTQKILNKPSGTSRNTTTLSFQSTSTSNNLWLGLYTYLGYTNIHVERKFFTEDDAKPNVMTTTTTTSFNNCCSVQQKVMLEFMIPRNKSSAIENCGINKQGLPPDIRTGILNFLPVCRKEQEWFPFFRYYLSLPTNTPV